MTQVANLPNDPDMPSPQEVAGLMKAIDEGRDLTPPELRKLKDAMRVVVKHEPDLMEVVLQQEFQQEIHSGPLPSHEQLNGYDEDTRREIVAMAVREQAHSHDMHRTGLNGAINKDRRGQVCAVIVALGALATAGWISQFSPTAAAIIGGLDIVSLVGIFLAPRILEIRAMKQAEQKAPAPPEKKRSGGRSSKK